MEILNVSGEEIPRTGFFFLFVNPRRLLKKARTILMGCSCLPRSVKCICMHIFALLCFMKSLFLSYCITIFLARCLPILEKTQLANWLVNPALSCTYMKYTGNYLPKASH